MIQTLTATKIGSAQLQPSAPSSRPQAWPRVMIILLNYNNEADTLACVAALAQATYPNFGIIIVENGSEAASREKIFAACTAHTVIALPQNRGFTGGCNAGIRRALADGADAVLLLNNDTLCAPDFIEPLVEALATRPEVGIATGKIFYAHDRERLWYAGGDLSRWRCGGVHRGFRKPDAPEFDVAGEITFANGCLMLIRKEVFARCGLFAEELHLYMDDVELSRRVGECYKLWYCPASRIYHRVGAGVRLVDYTADYFYFQTRNRFLIHRQARLVDKVYVFWFSSLLSLYRIVVLATDGKKHSKWTQIAAIGRGWLDGLRRFLWHGHR